MTKELMGNGIFPKRRKKVGLHSEKERIYSTLFSMEINSLLIMVLLSLWQTANSILIQNQIRKKKTEKGTMVE